MRNIFANIIKAQAEFKAGRIHRYSCGYSFSNAGYINRQGVFLAPLKDDDGKDVSLNGKESVRGCELPDQQGMYPKLKGVYWVPYSVCKKCRYYKPRATRGRPFAACGYLVQIRSAAPSPTTKLAELVNKAVNNAEQILTGSPISSKEEPEDNGVAEKMALFGKFFVK